MKDIDIKLLALRYINTDLTIRELAKENNIPKTKLHDYFTKDLPLICPLTYAQYCNKAMCKKIIGRIKGGRRTKIKHDYIRNSKK